MRKLQAFIDNIRLWLKNRPRTVRVSALVLAVAVILILPVGANAGSIKDFFLQIVARLFELLARMMGGIMIFEIRGLMAVAQYSNFVNPGPTAVRVGWVVTRDLANMFFILILLIIAFGTILGSETYHYTKTLKRLLIMAVVINFSKTITGVFIDFGQVIMLTFVNGFAQAAGGNFLRAFQVEKMLSMNADAPMDASALAGSMFLAFVLLTVAASVMLVMLVMLAFRIVMLWLIIIMSPIAFLASTMKQSQEYYAKWWKMLKDYIMTGPLLAFFLWLALISVQQGGGNIAQADGFTAIKTAGDIEAERQRAQTFSSEAGKDDALLSFVIATCLLLGGLKFAIESQTLGAGVAKGLQARAAGALKSAQGWAGKQAKRAVTAPYEAGKKVGQGALGLATKPFRAGGARFGEMAMRRGGGALANVPLIGGLARRAALKGEAMRAERLKKRTPLKDLARLSPRAFDSEAKSAIGNEVLDFAKAAQGDRLMMERMQKSGSADHIKNELWKRTKPDKDGNATDFAAKAEYDAFMKANWEGAKGAEQAKIMKGMSEEDSQRHIAPEKVTMESVGALGKNGVMGLMKGTKEQQQRLAGVFEVMEKNKPGSVAELMKNKGISVGQIPADFLNSKITAEGLITAGGEAVITQGVEGVTASGRKATVTQEGQLFQNAILRSARKDPSIANKMVENPKTAGMMGELAKNDLEPLMKKLEYGEELTKTEQADFKATFNIAVQTGNIGADRISPVGKMLSTAVDIKSLIDMARYAPTDREDIKQAVIEAVNAAYLNKGRSEGTRIEQHPLLSEFVTIKKEVAEAAWKAQEAADAAKKSPA